MAEDGIREILSQVERTVVPDEGFDEKLFATLATKLELSGAVENAEGLPADPVARILSQVERTVVPDEAFAERLYATLAARLEVVGGLRQGAGWLPATRSIVRRARMRLDGFRLQAALASGMVAALGIFALSVSDPPSPPERAPLAGPFNEAADPDPIPTFPSTPPNGCVCPTDVIPRRQPRRGTPGGSGHGDLPASAAAFRLAFARAPDSPTGRFQIYTMNLDGMDLRRVTPDDNNDYRQPSWSPDHKRLAFTRTSSHPQLARDGQIFVANADGSDMRQIAEGGSPEWSPDGSLIVYHASRGGGPGSDGPAIWTMKPDGTGKRYLTHDSTDPTWSPDGQHIAFGSIRSSDITAVSGVINEYRMRSDGSDVVQLTANPTLTCFADWSPDGKLIAYTSQLGIYTRLMLMSADGTGQRQITFDDVSNVAPSWSPDGSLIAFEHAPRGDTFYVARPAALNGEPASIWVMKPDGSLRRRVSPFDGWHYFDPAFAP